MSTSRPRVLHALTGANMFFMAGVTVFQAVRLGDPVFLALSSPIAFWIVSVGLMSLGYSLWPHRFPRLTTPTKPNWMLRRRKVRETVERLRALGFEDIGIKQERTFVIRIQTWELWHPEHRTNASVSTSFVALLVPQVTFLTRGDDGTLVYTGRSVSHRVRNLVCHAAPLGDVEARFADHLRAVKGEDLRTAGPPGEDLTHAARLEERLELCREWYVVSFGTDAQLEAWRRGAGREVPVGSIET